MDAPNESMSMVHAIDMAKVLDLAIAGAMELRETEPRVATALLASIEQAGGAAVVVARWPDGGAAIAVGVREVWSGRLEELLRHPPARLDA